MVEPLRPPAAIRKFAGAIVLTILSCSPASARGFGKFPAGCLISDSPFKNGEGLAPVDAAVAVTVSPNELWPRNRPFSVIRIGVSLPWVVQPDSSIEPDLAANSITDDEIGEDYTGGVHHYEYVFPDGNLYVYDMDNHFRLVKHLSIPTGAGVRGVIASAATGRIYVSYGSDNSAGRGGSMLAYDLIHDTVLWLRNYPFGIDSMSISPDGRKIYMPTGENTTGGIWQRIGLASGGIWEILDAGSGDVIGSIDSGGRGPHNTVVSRDGDYVFMGPRGNNYLVMADTTTNKVMRQIGPVADGVRPFTINGRSTLAFITTTGFLGFSVGDVKSGQILYIIQVHGFPTTGGAASAPSHGISLSPDGKEIYLVDSINSYVHVFDVSGLPGSPPKQVADIKLKGKLSGNEHGCAYDCTKDGWLHHSRNGRYVFVGDSGDVINTRLRKTVATLPAMANSRKEIEIDIQNGKTVWAMNNRSSIGMRN